MDNAWPTFEQAEALAKKASDDGWRLNLTQRKNGFSWVWLHVKSSFTFTGACTSRQKPVALVCALMGVPVVSG